MSTLELRGLNKTYDDAAGASTWAVRHVDLHVDDGELHVILGPSGCGKTTLLRMVAGLEDATAGDVLVDGERVNDVRVHRRDVAMAFQHHALYPHMTVAENIGFPLYVERVHRELIERRVAEVARTLRIDDVLDRRPSELSGGQRQRTGLARSIIRRPRLLLMDEPMSSLDAKLRGETRYVIADLQRRLGITTLHVTHDQDEAMAMGHRISVMREGRIVQTGAPMEVYDDPIDLFVAQFVGAPQMNTIRATVVDGGRALRIGGDTLALTDDARRYAGLGAMDGDDVAVGIRAGDISAATDGSLAVSVMSGEQAERRMLLGLRLDAPAVHISGDDVVVGHGRSSTIVMSAPPDTAVDLWTPFRVDFDPARLHLFDLRTGRSLARCAG